jgi:hypothetical protein
MQDEGTPRQLHDVKLRDCPTVDVLMSLALPDRSLRRWHGREEEGRCFGARFRRLPFCPRRSIEGVFSVDLLAFVFMLRITEISRRRCHSFDEK